MNSSTSNWVKKTVLIVAALFLLSGCDVIGEILGLDKHEVKGPEKIVPPIKSLQEESVIQLPVSIKTSEIQKTIMKDLHNPLVKGKSDRISANILATETITERELIKVLVSPATIGYWEERTKRVKKTFEETFKCLLKPWKWGHCKRAVERWVTEPFKVLIPPVAAVSKYVSKDIANIIDKVFKTGVWVGHEVHLTNFKLRFEGNKVYIDSSFKINLMVDYEQAAVPLGPKVKIKGILNGDINADVSIIGKVVINENAELQIDIPKDGAHIKITKLFVPTAVEMIDFQALMRPELLLAKKVIGDVVDKQIVKQIQKQIAKNKEDMAFKEDIEKLVLENSNPIPLSKGTWLCINPSKISISQIKGMGEGAENMLFLNVGITARPNVILSDSEPMVTIPSKVDIKTEEFSPQVKLVTELCLTYRYVEQKVEKELKEMVDTKYADKPYTTGKVELYPNNDKLVLAIDLNKRKNNKHVVTLYAWGKPFVDNKKKEVRLDDFNFTVETESYLIKAANWLARKHIIEYLSDKVVFSYEEKFTKLSNVLSSIESASKTGIFKGSINTLEVKDIYTTAESINVLVLACGNAEYLISLPEPKLSLSTKKSIEKVAILSHVPNEVFHMNPTVSPIVQKKIGTIRSKEKNELPNPFIKIGDTIYTQDENGTIYEKIAGPADATVPGEKVLVVDRSGNVIEMVYQP